MYVTCITHSMIHLATFEGGDIHTLVGIGASSGFGFQRCSIGPYGTFLMESRAWGTSDLGIYQSLSTVEARY